MSRKIEPNVFVFLEAAAALYGHVQAEEFSQSAYMACIERMQSPIEDLFWIALNVRLAAERQPLNEAPEYWPGKPEVGVIVGVHCWPQRSIGKFTVDFCLEFAGAPGVVVELDGHAFHDKDKHQRAYEKARDRFLVRQGYRVLHFTGSEVVADPYKIVHEVLETLGALHPDRLPYDPAVPLGEIYA